MENTGKAPSDNQGEARETASRVLEDIVAKVRRTGGETIRLGDILTGAGTRIYGLALFLFALPEALPLPTGGLTAVVAIPLFAVSAWMMVFGMKHSLPGWLRNRTIKRSWVETGIAKSMPWVRRLERYSRPRREYWAEFGRLLGTVCLILSVLLALPIPFGNIAPALCIAAIGTGVFQRDGLVVLIALFASLLVAVGMAAVLVVLGRAVPDVLGSLW